MITINIKPMSLNEAWQGRRFLTKKAKDYIEIMLWILPKKLDIPKGKLQLNVVFYVSSKLADADNGIKLFADILQTKYSFNDRQIYRYEIEKVDVKKGQEKIEFEITNY